MRPTIGVLITYFNEKELLTECINSLLSQTLKPDEIIVYDDGSEFPARDYIPKDCSIRVIRSEENRGPGYGRNKLFGESRSEYVHFHDSDDLFKPAWCEKVSRVIADTHADIVFSEISTFKDSRLIGKSILNLKLLAKDKDAVRFALRGSLLTASSTLRREAFLKVKGYHTREILPQSEDFDFHIRVLAAGTTHAEILDPLIIQRLRSTSHSSKNIVQAWSSAIVSIDMLSKVIPEKYRKDLSEAAARVGHVLYKLKASDYAKKAYYLSRRLGPEGLLTRHWQFRLIARMFGPETAEWIGDIFRRLIPNFEKMTKRIAHK